MKFMLTYYIFHKKVHNTYLYNNNIMILKYFFLFLYCIPLGTYIPKLLYILYK